MFSPSDADVRRSDAFEFLLDDFDEGRLEEAGLILDAMSDDEVLG
jgi:hypothetical protein